MAAKKPFGNLKKGALHDQLDIPRDKKIPVERLEAAKNSPNPLTRKRANFALAAKKFSHK